MRRTNSVLAAMLATALLAACGTQVDSATRRQLEAQQLEQTGGTVDTAPVTGGVAPTTPVTVPSEGGVVPPVTTGTGGATSGQTGTTTTGSGKTTGGKSGGTTTTTSSTGLPPGVGAPAPAGGNGGSTDVGVTANQILLGNVSDLSGPQPGLFQSAVNGTNAYIAYINSLGGIYGRQLKIDVADSQTSCEGDRNGIDEEIGKVFAFAGSASLNDQCGATVLATHKTVPDAHLAVTPQANALPNNYSVTPIGTKVSNGPFDWVTKRFGHDVVQHTGFLYANLPAVNNVASLSIHSAETVGWKFVVHSSVSPTSTDFTAQIIQMRQAGVKLFYTLFDAQELAEFVRNANQQNFHPLIFAPLAYDQTFFTDLGNASLANGIYGFNGETMFFSAGDIANIPATALFHKWYSAVTGNGAADSFAADAWAETELLVDAIASVGPDLTRQKVLAALSKVHSFDANGFFAPSDPAAKKAGNCFVPWVIKDGQYVRTGVAPTKYLCQGTPE
ncbi:MAG TPA: ABC transporter substrate-binding protein [Mycobacteriales bacterium]|nr:ABC transporter substrate-binding protein [Mycobacteriales bacterium]